MIAYDVEGTAHRCCRWLAATATVSRARVPPVLLDLPQLNYLISLFGAEQEIAIILPIRMG
jgi:hypothetical protein